MAYKEITKKQLNDAKFDADVYGGWVNKEKYKRLKESYSVQEKIKKLK